jgi:hypothetical protein
MNKNIGIPSSIQESEVSSAEQLRTALKTEYSNDNMGRQVSTPVAPIKKCRITNFIKASLDLWAKIVKLIGKCELCGCYWQTLHAHHMIPKSGLGIKYSRDPKNGICLCESCHKKAHPGWSRFRNSGLAIHELHERIKEKCPQKYQWMMTHKDDKRFVELDYEKIYHELKVILEAKQEK